MRSEIQEPEVLVAGGVRFDTSVVIPPGFNPTADVKRHSEEWGHDFGGSAARAAEMIAGLGGMRVTLVSKGSDDEIGVLYRERARRKGIVLIESMVKKFPSAVALLSGRNRAVILCDDPADEEVELTSLPHINLSKYEAAYFDGRLPNIAVELAKRCREARVPVLLDACAGRKRTDELMKLSNVVIASELLCRERGLSPMQFLEYLQGIGCPVGAVTLSGDGNIWYETGGQIQHLSAHAVPYIVNVNGAGDAFHAIYFRSFVMHPLLPTVEHFLHGRAAAAHIIQHMSGPDRRLTLEDIEAAKRLPVSSARPDWV